MTDEQQHMLWRFVAFVAVLMVLSVLLFAGAL